MRPFVIPSERSGDRDSPKAPQVPFGLPKPSNFDRFYPKSSTWEFLERQSAPKCPKCTLALSDPSDRPKTSYTYEKCKSLFLLKFCFDFLKSSKIKMEIGRYFPDEIARSERSKRSKSPQSHFGALSRPQVAQVLPALCFTRSN